MPATPGSALAHCSASTCWPPACPASDPRYRRALFHLLACETSCYRYWGQGTWTGYGAELARRASQAASSAA